MPVVVFCLFFVLQNINIKRSPNAMKLFGDFFLDITNTRSFGRRPKAPEGAHEAPGRAGGGGRRALVPRGAHRAPFDLIPPL